MNQIALQNPMENPAQLHEQRESSQLVSETNGKFPDVKTSTVLPSEDSSNVGNLHTSTQGTIERIGTGHIPNASEMGNGNSFLEDTGSLSFRESSFQAQPKISGSNSPVENESMPSEAQIEQSFTEENRISSTTSRNIKGRSEFGSQINEIECKSILDRDKDGQFDTGNKSWWLKLPYVLAIFLHRDSDSNGPKGLYSLKMNSPEDDGTFPSYTIFFQDRSDATNFCYILESFFEDLGDFSADIVPLTIQEVDEAVKSGASKVIVVRKGQLRLYAGQPLSEVEAALCSFLD